MTVFALVITDSNRELIGELLNDGVVPEVKRDESKAGMPSSFFVWSDDPEVPNIIVDRSSIENGHIRAYQMGPLFHLKSVPRELFELKYEPPTIQAVEDPSPAVRSLFDDQAELPFKAGNQHGLERGL